MPAVCVYSTKLFFSLKINLPHSRNYTCVVGAIQKIERNVDYTNMCSVRESNPRHAVQQTNSQPLRLVYRACDNIIPVIALELVEK